MQNKKTNLSQMAGKSKNNYTNTDFIKLFEGYSEYEITEVLKKRKHYREEAATAAINEAIKRGIIHSEHDLFAEKYRVEPLNFSLFPNIGNTTSRLKLRKSMTRSLLFLGAIIIVWGVWEIYRHNFIDGAGFVLAGAIWNIISYSFFKSVKNQKIYVLFTIQGISAVYAAIKLATYKNLVFMDVFIVVVLFGFVVYGLIYMKNLHD